MTCHASKPRAFEEPLWDPKSAFSAETSPQGTGDSGFRAQGSETLHPEGLDWHQWGTLSLRPDVRPVSWVRSPLTRAWMLCGHGGPKIPGRWAGGSGCVSTHLRPGGPSCPGLTSPSSLIQEKWIHLGFALDEGLGIASLSIPVKFCS